MAYALRLHICIPQAVNVIFSAEGPSQIPTSRLVGSFANDCAWITGKPETTITLQSSDFA